MRAPCVPGAARARGAAVLSLVWFAWFGSVWGGFPGGFWVDCARGFPTERVTLPTALIRTVDQKRHPPDEDTIPQNVDYIDPKSKLPHPPSLSSCLLCILFPRVARYFPCRRLPQLKIVNSARISHCLLGQCGNPADCRLLFIQNSPRRHVHRLPAHASDGDPCSAPTPFLSRYDPPSSSAGRLHHAFSRCSMIGPFASSWFIALDRRSRETRFRRPAPPRARSAPGTAACRRAAAGTRRPRRCGPSRAARPGRRWQ